MKNIIENREKMLYAIDINCQSAYIESEDNVMSIEFSEYINKDISCSCGRVHSCHIRDIIIKDNAVKELTGIIDRQGYADIFIAADNNTWKAAGKQVLKAIEQAARGDEGRRGIKVTKYIFRQEELIPDEASVSTLLINAPDKCDLIIGIGSGTINDMCKLISCRMKNDYCIVATAPSMDGFASNVSPLILNHLKTTIETKIPEYIIGDLNILKDAPKPMIAAGVGDILGKYVCLTDWRLAHLINGEYHCSSTEKLVRKSIEAVASAIRPHIGEESNDFLQDKGTIESVMEGLVLSGIAMSYVGNSRPASGSEHHLSHYWEMMFLFEGRKMVLHGTKVAIGTVKVIKLYEKLKRHIPDFAGARDAAGFNKKEWKKEIRRVYREASDAVIELEEQCHKNSDEEVIRRLTLLEKNWDEAVRIMDTLPASDYIEDMLKAMNAPYKAKQVGVDKQMLKDSVKYAKELRDRYGLLQILFDLHM